jgi:F-type H+-transporting ATPase subunit b
LKYLACCVVVFGITASSIHAQINPSAEARKPIAQEERDMSAWEWANFAILAAVLAYFGVKLGKPYFAGQTKQINTGLAEARRRREEAEKRSEQVQRKLNNLGSDIENFRAAVLTEQAGQADRMRKQAELDLQRLQATAEQQIDSVGKQARLDLRRHASKLALELAEQRVRERMNPALQDELAGQFVADLRA